MADPVDLYLPLPVGEEGTAVGAAAGVPGVAEACQGVDQLPA